MNSLKLIGNHAGKLVPLAVSALYPPNLTVVFKNLFHLLKGRSWDEFMSLNEITYDMVIEGCMNWIKYSQDKVNSGGVGCYEFYRWTKGYPEVTGYIIPTFWDYFNENKSEDIKTRAIRMSDWLLSIQKPEGGWEGYYEGDGQPPIVFNTGQIIRGLVRSYRETGQENYLQAARRAADWIVKGQDPDGSWTTNNYKGMKRVYDTYVAASLAQLYRVTRDEALLNSCRRNCDFAITQQRPNGWFDRCDNTLYNDAAPITHTICYTIDGLIETGILLEEDEYIQAGKKAADALLHKFEILPYLPARLNEKWLKKANYVCNTGNAQLGIIFIRLYEITNDPRYLNAALKIADFLAFVQAINGVGKARKGGITGSYPIWGMYCPLKYPSWATKYTIELFLLLKKYANSN